LDARTLADYVGYAQEAVLNVWREQSLRGLSHRQIPSSVLGPHAWLLEADARLTWTSWYVDGLVDRSRYVYDRSLGYSRLYAEMQGQLHDQNPGLPVDEVRMAASALSELAWEDIVKRRDIARGSLSKSDREELWYAAEPDPRCYLCGYLFTPLARDRYLERRSARSVTLEDLPLLVDFTRPRGLVVRDLAVEVDHVTAVSAGGRSYLGNLQLACGWCNKVKSNLETLYDVPATFAGAMPVHGLGIVSLPRPLWVLRIVATRGRCEYSKGCSATLQDNELYIAPYNLNGMLNPVNCRIYCQEHDPWSTIRFIGRDAMQGRR